MRDVVSRARPDRQASSRCGKGGIVEKLTAPRRVRRASSQSVANKRVVASAPRKLKDS